MGLICPETPLAPYFASPPGASRTAEPWAWSWTAVRPACALVAEDIQKELDRRRPGQSRASTARQEEDRVEILSGIFEGLDHRARPSPCSSGTRTQIPPPTISCATNPRPGHADYAYQMKYGLRDHRGGGRASARETVGRVAAGAVAKKLLTCRQALRLWLT